MPILQGCRNGNDKGVGGSQLFLSTQLPAYDRAANHDIEMGLYDGGHAGVIVATRSGSVSTPITSILFVANAAAVGSPT